MRLRILTLLMLTLFTVSCAGSAKPALEIQEPWVTEAKISAISAADVNKSCLCDVKTAATTTTAYMTIQNNTRAADHLLKVESDAASRIEFRRNDLAGDLLNPAPVDSIEIPANGKIYFAPGNYAMILMGIKKDLIPGQKETFSLFFDKAGKVDVTMEIRAR